MIHYAYETLACRPRTCDHCSEPFGDHEWVVGFRDTAGDYFQWHKRCAQKYSKIQVVPLPRLRWKQTHKRRWETNLAGDTYVILAQRIGVRMVYGCILNETNVFSSAYDLQSAIAKAEMEAFEKNLRKNEEKGLAFLYETVYNTKSPKATSRHVAGEL